MATKFDSVRNELLTQVAQLFESEGYEVLRTGTQEICLPIVNEDRDEGYLVITFKIPKGSRDGEQYDGYAAAEDFQIRLKKKTKK